MHDYPSAPRFCYSLKRLFTTRALPHNGPVWVGGQVARCFPPQLELFGQGFRLVLSAQASVPDLQVGDHVAVELRPEDLKTILAQDQQAEPLVAVVSGAPRLIKLTQKMKSWEKPSRLQPHLNRRWQDFLRRVDTHLRNMGLEPVQTPSLVVCPGMEPHLEPFATEFVMGRQRRPLFLPTSPEIHLKKLLASGWTDIFEIKQCFRNGELSVHHEPEFLLLEWYRAYADLDQIRHDLKTLVTQLAGQENESLLLHWQEVTMADLFAEHVGLQLKPQTTRQELGEACTAHELKTTGQEDWDDLFHYLFVTCVEPRLPKEPLMISQFPPSQAALARLTPDGWADRFEFYWQGVEIANAFHELNDPDEQRRRFANDMTLRTQLGRTPVPLDTDFLAALTHGMPPSGGIALGLDRLFMVLENLSDIGCFKAFPYGR